MLIQAIVGLINLIIKAIGFVIGSAINLLPKSPFVTIINQLNISGQEINKMLQYINSVFDIPLIITILNIWLASIVIYYLSSIILKWVKAL